MKRKASIALLFVLILMGACKKQEFPEPSVSEPIFSVSATISGQPFNLSPGADGSYMYTDHSEIDEGSVVLSSGIAPLTCPECGPALWIDWNSNTGGGISEPFDPELHFTNGPYTIRQGTGAEVTTMEIANFDELQDEGAVFTLDGNNLTESTAILSSINGFIEVGYVNSLDPLALVQINMVFSSLLFPAQCSGNDPVTIENFGFEMSDDEGIIHPPQGQLENYEINWTINGFVSLQSIGAEPIQFEFEPNSLITIDAISLDENGNLLWSVSSIFFGAELGVNVEPLELELSNIPGPTFGDPDVVIRYVDQDGLVYSSSICNSPSPQPPGSFFSITDQELFQANEAGVSTRIATVNASVLLFPENGEDLDPISVDFEGGSFGFATGD